MTVPDAVCFDLDGVLVDTRRIHWLALNEGLRAVGADPLTWTGHLPYDGLPTAEKLRRLDITDPLAAAVKQAATERMLKGLFPCKRLVRLFDALPIVGVASNAVRSTVDLCLARLELAPTFSLSNEDVTSPKPDPEIYVKAAGLAGVPPARMLVVEDRPLGVAAAKAAGCPVLQVSNPDEVTYARVAAYGGPRPTVR